MAEKDDNAPELETSTDGWLSDDELLARAEYLSGEAPEEGGEQLEQPAPTEGGDEEPEASGEPDWQDDLPEAARTEFDDMRARLERAESDRKAAVNHTAPIQRQNAELQQQLSAMRAELDALKKEEADEPPPLPTDPEEWTKFEEEYPEEAKPHKAYHAALRDEMEAKYGDKIAKLENTINTMQGDVRAQTETLEGQRRQEEINLLNGNPEFEGWVDLTNSDEFVNWVNDSDDAIKGWYQSDSASNYQRMIRLYRAEKGIQVNTAAKENEAAADPSEAERIKRKEELRRKQLADASPETGGRPTTPTRDDRDAPGDEDAIAEDLIMNHPDLEHMRAEFG